MICYYQKSLPNEKSEGLVICLVWQGLGFCVFFYLNLFYSVLQFACLPLGFIYPSQGMIKITLSFHPGVAKLAIKYYLYGALKLLQRVKSFCQQYE